MLKLDKARQKCTFRQKRSCKSFVEMWKEKHNRKKVNIIYVENVWISYWKEFTTSLMIAKERIAIRIPIKDHISNLLACFILSGLHCAVISLNHQITNTTIQISPIENRRYWLMVSISLKNEDSSQVICVGPVTATSCCPLPEGTSTTIADTLTIGNKINVVVIKSLLNIRSR